MSDFSGFRTNQELATNAHKFLTHPGAQAGSAMMWMMKKQTVVALVLLLLIPMVAMLGGLLFSLINPEIAAGHPNYVRSYHFLSVVRNMSFWASGAVVVILWLLGCFLVIRSKERSTLWLFTRYWGPSGSPFWRC